MNYLFRMTLLGVVGLLVIGFSFCFSGQVQGADSSTMNVGAALVEITPDEPVYLSGFASRTEKSSGIRGRLFAQALFLQQGKEQVLWVVCDLLGFEVEDADVLREKLAKENHLPLEQVILSTTHTHSAPATQPIGKYKEPEYLQHFLTPRLVKLTKEAMTSVEKCEVILAEGNCDLAHDRRNTPIVGDPAAPNPDADKAYIDPRVPAIAFRRADGSFKAIMMEYAMHPTSHSDYLITPEWPGAAAIAIKRTFGGNVVPFVLQGACGNINPPARKASDEEMQSWGDAIVAAFADQLKKGTPLPNASFAVRTKTIRVELATKTAEEVQEMAVAKRKDYERRPDLIEGTVNLWESRQLERLKKGTADHINTQIAVVVFGNRALLTTPFETFCQLNPEIAQYVETPVYVIGYCNGVFNYLPTADAIDQGGYETNQAYWYYTRFPTARGALEAFAKETSQLINEALKETTR